MTSTGSIKAVISADAALTPGEDRTLRFTVEDEAGVAVSSFASWTFGWYLLPRQDTPRTHADVLLTKTSGSGITSAVPNVDVALDPADTLLYKAGTRFYELWCTDTGNVVRLAYGPIVFID